MHKKTKYSFRKWAAVAAIFLFLQTGCLKVKLSPFNNTEDISTILIQSVLADFTEFGILSTPVYENPELLTLNYPGSITPSFSGTPTSCTISPPLPSGLSIDPDTCIISGTATVLLAKTTYTITAENPLGKVTATVVIGVVQPFQFKVKTDNAGNVITGTNQFQLPLDSGGTYNFKVDWGDASSNIITAWDQAEKLHTYGGAGTYTITISGKINGFGFINDTAAPYTEDHSKLIDVANWGQVKLHNNGGQFASCNLLPGFTAADTPELSHITNMSFMFVNAALFNVDISAWDTSSVRNMRSLFNGAAAFNQPLNTWNTSSVNDMQQMFNDAAVFNGDITTWNTSSVTNMSQMFRNAAAFNQAIGSWNTSSVTNMNFMFGGAAAFSQPLNTWNTSSVTNMSWMFTSAAVFNQPLNAWDTSSVTTMRGTFNGAFLFNQPLNTWNTASVTDMSAMFWQAEVFNQPLNLWNTSAVTNMDIMFLNALVFNQNLTTWCVTSLITSPPTNFNTSSALTAPNLPVWGTCP